jgi:hypothetical protein
VIEDGVILRPGQEEFLLTSAEPNLAWFADRIGRMDVGLEEATMRSVRLRSRLRLRESARGSSRRRSTSRTSA